MITIEDVKAALEAVARECRYHVDPRLERKLAPRYVEHGEPCCLVAVILHRLGFTTAQLKQLDTEPGTDGGGIILSESQHPLLKRVDPVALALLVYIQRRQDIHAEEWALVADRALQRGRYAPDTQRVRGYAYDKAARMVSSDPFPWNQPPADVTAERRPI